MNKKVDIYVSNKNIIPLIHYVQYSTEIPIEFQLMDYIIPQGATARYYIKKPSGLEVYNECQIQGNSVILQPTAQTFAESGRNQAQIQIVIAEKILVSFILKFEIEKNIITDSAIPSSNEFGILDSLIQQAQQELTNVSVAVTNATNAAANADSAAVAANAAANNAEQTASSVGTAIENANTAATSANESAQSANTAATAANNAATAANEAAQNVEDLISGVSPSDLTSTVYNVNNIVHSAANINFTTSSLFPDQNGYFAYDNSTVNGIKKIEQFCIVNLRLDVNRRVSGDQLKAGPTNFPVPFCEYAALSVVNIDRDLGAGLNAYIDYNGYLYIQVNSEGLEALDTLMITGIYMTK